MTQTGLRVWFRDEIENALLAVNTSNEAIAKHVNTPEMALYQLGFATAIKAVAVAFGVEWKDNEDDTTQSLARR